MLNVSPLPDTTAMTVAPFRTSICWLSPADVSETAPSSPTDTTSLAPLATMLVVEPPPATTDAALPDTVTAAMPDGPTRTTALAPLAWTVAKPTEPTRSVAPTAPSVMLDAPLPLATIAAMPV